MIVKKKGLKKYLCDLGVVALIATIASFIIQYLIPDPPYHSVTRVNIAPKNNDLYITALYVHGTCTFRTLDVYGGINGREKPLKWKTLDGYDNFDMDRTAGKMHLALKVEWNKVRYDTITVVTEHFCPYGIVQKTFLSEDLDQFVFYNP